MSNQSRFDARYWMLEAGALGRPRGMVWGRRRVQDGEHMYTCGRFILIYGKTNIVKLKNKIKKIKYTHTKDTYDGHAVFKNTQ